VVEVDHKPFVLVFAQDAVEERGAGRALLADQVALLMLVSISRPSVRGRSVSRAK